MTDTARELEGAREALQKIDQESIETSQRFETTRDEGEIRDLPARIESLRRQRIDAESKVNAATEAHRATGRKELAASVHSTFDPLDAGLLDAIDQIAAGLSQVVETSTNRDNARVYVRQQIMNLGAGDGITGEPNPSAGGYSLRSTKDDAMTTLAALLVEPFKALNEGRLAADLQQRATAGNPLQRPSEDTAKESVNQ